MRRTKSMLTISLLALATGALCLTAALPGFAGARKTSTAASSKQAQIAHGEYLVKDVAGCADCHTPMDKKGQLIQSEWLKGATLQFAPIHPIPEWAAHSADIAGLRGWTSEQAIHLLMTGVGPSGRRPLPPMPQYRMNHTDAAAVVAYLKSLK